MARVYQMMGSKSPEILRNACAGGQVVLGGTSVTNVFGGFAATAGGANSAGVTWIASDSDITPVVVCNILHTGVGTTNMKQAVPFSIASNSCAIAGFVGAGTATATASVQVMVFGQARNDFKTT